MRIVGSVPDIETIDADGDSRDAGIVYEVCLCHGCEKPVLRAGDWNDGMEDRSEWTASTVYPDETFREARDLFAQRSADRRFMDLAVEEASKSVPDEVKETTPASDDVKESESPPDDVKKTPFVGAVVAHGSKLVAFGHRGELKRGDHAEFTVLEGKCETTSLAGATVYTTLEPCTSRNPPKMPCVQRLIARKVARVVIGMLDPNEIIRGKGVLALRKANIQVDLFPPDLMNRLEEMNRAFIRDQEEEARRALDAIGASGADDKYVNASYVESTGIRDQLTEEGYTAAWVTAQDESEYLDVKKWEYALQKGDGAPRRLKIRDTSAAGGYLVFLKKKQASA
jgi:pyrimidine deaminase RibD-like protein